MKTKRKLISMLLATSLAATPVAGQLVFSQSAEASTLTPAEEAKIQEMINRLQSNGGLAVLQELQGLINNHDEEIKQIFGQDFLNAKATDGSKLFADDNEAVTIAKLVAGLLTNGIVFTEDLDSFRKGGTNDKSELFHKAFGDDVDVQTLKDFSQAVASKAVSLMLTKTDPQSVTITSITNEAIRAVLDDSSLGFSHLNGRLTNMGLSVDKLIEIKDNLYASSIFGAKAREARGYLITRVCIYPL